MILQPQGDHQLDAALVHADHPLRRLFVGVLHHIAGVVIVGDGDGVVVIRRGCLWFGSVLVNRCAVGHLRSICFGLLRLCGSGLVCVRLGGRTGRAGCQAQAKRQCQQQGNDAFHGFILLV